MKPTPILALLLACASPLANAETKAAKPRVEVCFVLDTTGSMSGLLEGAKQKIWSIANQIISAKPTPELKIGLVAYRDRGDEYVVKSFPLTDDIDATFADLTKFKAGGGGDQPESVNEALSEAVHKMSWSQDRETLKVVFLVGDAPPHMDYKDGPKYPEICKEAMKNDLIINTIQCGNIASTTPIWQEIAKLSEGSFAAIAQTGNVAVIETPMDAKLAALNREIGDTLVPYGSDKDQRAVLEKQANSSAKGAPAAADRLSFNATTAKAVQGGNELLGALADGSVKLESIPKTDLPADLQKLSPEELKKRLDEKQQTRTALQKEIGELSRQRTEFIQAEAKRRATAGKGDSFDDKITEMIRKEAAKKGIDYTR